MAELVLEIPDGSIRKQIIRTGVWGLKPTENCDCNIDISECRPGLVEKYVAVNLVVIGDSNTNFERLLDHCLQTMLNGEVAKVIFNMKDNQEESFVLKLCSFQSKGLIYEWDAKKKYELALKHKEQGFKLYNESKIMDASYRFGKGLKILCSIPIEVDEPPKEVDGIKVETIYQLKATLYNNLAACYLKHCDYETVLTLCPKVLHLDSTNIKALYKQAVAKYETHDYEGSQKVLLELLKLDPENKTASDKLKCVNVKVAEGNAKVNAMIKKMFEK